MKSTSDEEIIRILQDFQPKINKSLQNTFFQDREDLEQEIKIKIIEKLATTKFNKGPSLWELLD